MSSAAVVIGTLRVKVIYSSLGALIFLTILTVQYIKVLTALVGPLSECRLGNWS